MVCKLNPKRVDSSPQVLPSVTSLKLANAIFFGLFSIAYFLLHYWREKIRTSTPLLVIIAFKANDEEIMKSTVLGLISSYSLESRLGDCWRAAMIRCEAMEGITERSLEGLPLEGFDSYQGGGGRKLWGGARWQRWRRGKGEERVTATRWHGRERDC